MWKGAIFLKYVKWSFLFFLLYCVLAYIYIFVYADTSIPDHLIGSVADPNTFMNQQEMLESQQYASIKNFFYLILLPFEWLVLFFIFVSGVAKKFDQWAQQISRFPIIQAAIFTFYFSILSFIIDFPFSMLSFYINRMYSVSVQSFHSFMRDEWVDFWVSSMMMYILVFVVYWLMRKSVKRWWFYAWLLSIPFTLFVVFIQPVLVDPLYQDFSEIENKDLESKILALAQEANIPAGKVYQVEMSDETNAMNAYVTGIGSNARIVLWDTTLNGLTEDEILFIMAHEMSHYIHKDIYQNIAIQLFFSLLITYFVIRRLEERTSEDAQGLNLRRYASWPLILLVASMVSFVTDPISNFISRHDERVCDAYAVELTKKTEAGILAFQALSKNGLSEVNPPKLIKWLRYSHPSLMERLETLDQQSKQNDK